jgi:uncharacterized membrane protein
VQLDPQRSDVPFHWFFLVVATVAVTVTAFGVLLGYRFSPEAYNSYAIIPGIVELVWICLALVAAVVTVVVVFSRRDRWPDWVRSALPFSVVSLVILAKSFFHSPVRCYDMILWCFSFAGGIARMIRGVHSASEAQQRNHGIWPFAFGLAVWLAVTALAIYYIWQQVGYWNNLALGYSDCGAEASIVYNTLHRPHELFLRTNLNHPMFWDHFNPGVLAFVPLWWIWPDIKLVIVLQVVSIVGVSLPLYWIGKLIFKETIAALLLVLAWLAYPSTSLLVYSTSFGFRWGSLCLPLYFLGLLAWLKGRKGWALAAAIGALSMKEEAAIVIGMFGLYLAVFERRRALGLAITTVAFGYFLMVSNVMIPRLDLGYYRQIRFFAPLGRSTEEILLSPLLKPRVFWGLLLEPRSWYFAAALLAPVLFLPLKKPSILMIGLLTFVFDCLNPVLKSLSYQYQTALLPVVFWALAVAVAHKTLLQRRALLAGATVSGILLSLFLGNTFWSKDTLAIPTSPGRLEIVHRLGRDIRENDSLFATQRIAAHYVNQRAIYAETSLPGDLDFAFLDLQDMFQMEFSLRWFGTLRDLQRQVEALPGLHLVAAEDSLVLYSRRGTTLDAQRLVELDALPQQAARLAMDLGNGVRTEGFTVTAVPSRGKGASDAIRVTTFSTVLTHTNVDLAVRCMVRVDTGTSEPEIYASRFKPLGQAIWPIARWETNKVYQDDFLIPLPVGMSGNKVVDVRLEALLVLN